MLTVPSAFKESWFLGHGLLPSLRVLLMALRAEGRTLSGPTSPGGGGQGGPQAVISHCGEGGSLTSASCSPPLDWQGTGASG